MRLFSGTRGHRKPNPKQNCVQNYWDHMNSIEQDAHRLWNKVDTGNWFKVLAGEAWNRTNMLEALRDGHDYTDEIMGAVVGSTVYSAVATGFLALALWEAVCGLAMKAGFVKDDKKDHVTPILKALVFAVAAYVMSLVIYLKSVVSLITRPIITALEGFKAQDTNRFYDNEQRNDDVPATTSFAM